LCGTEPSDSANYLRLIVPALIAGVSCVGIVDLATFGYAGSAYGFSLLWSLVLLFFFSFFILQITAQVGLATKCGFLSNIKMRYGHFVAVFVAFLISSANVAIITAEIAGSSSLLSSIVGFSITLWAPLLSLLICVLSVKSYSQTIKNVLVMTSFIMIVCVPAAILSSPPLGGLVRGFLSVEFHPSRDFMLTLMAIIGTQISGDSLLFEASEASKKPKGYGVLTLEFVGMMVGVFMGILVDASILITCASQLYPKGLVIDSVEEAILALKPALGDVVVYMLAFGAVASSFLRSAVAAISNLKILDELVDDLAEVLRIRAAILSGWKIILASVSFLIAPLFLAFGASPLKLVINASALTCVLSPIPLIFLSLLFTGIRFPEDVHAGLVKAFCWFITIIISVISVVGLAFTAFG